MLIYVNITDMAVQLFQAFIPKVELIYIVFKILFQLRGELGNIEIYDGLDVNNVSIISRGGVQED